MSDSRVVLNDDTLQRLIHEVSVDEKNVNKESVRGIQDTLDKLVPFGLISDYGNFEREKMEVAARRLCTLMKIKFSETEVVSKDPHFKVGDPIWLQCARVFTIATALLSSRNFFVKEESSNDDGPPVDYSASLMAVLCLNYGKGYKLWRIGDVRDVSEHKPLIHKLKALSESWYQYGDRYGEHLIRSVCRMVDGGLPENIARLVATSEAKQHTPDLDVSKYKLVGDSLLELAKQLELTSKAAVTAAAVPAVAPVATPAAVAVDTAPAAASVVTVAAVPAKKKGKSSLFANTVMIGAGVVAGIVGVSIAARRR